MTRLVRELVIAAVFGIFVSRAGGAVSQLDLQLIAAPANSPGDGLENVTLQARASGTGTGLGDGGLSDLEFSIVSTDNGLLDAIAAGTGTLAGKAKIVWNSVITSNFAVVNPNRTDIGADGDFDVLGAAFFDPNHFRKTDLGTGGWVDIATVQFQLTPSGFIDGSHLTVVPSYYRFYDFTNGRSPDFRGAFDSVRTAGVQFWLDVPAPVTDQLTEFPEPAGIGLLAAVGAMTLVRRRPGLRRHPATAD